jgi:hypothetical protein
MSSLADLFNPTFFLFLGILVLVVALLVVYFESKMRDQNHKISSMFSIVSTLAEDMNGVKMGLNHLAVTRVGGSFSPNFQEPLEQQNIPFVSNKERNLIEVSDNEDASDDDYDSDDSENDDDDKSEDEEINDEIVDVEELDDDEDASLSDIKVLKLNINSSQIDDIDEDNNLNSQEIDDLEELEDTLSESQSILDFETNDENNGEDLTLHEFETENSVEKKDDFISSSDLKKISINLEESIDYKKLPLQKLRNIVSEKGLSSDSSKLKKNELLKLLGAE